MAGYFWHEGELVKAVPRRVMIKDSYLIQESAEYYHPRAFLPSGKSQTDEACQTSVKIDERLPYQRIPCTCGEVEYVWRAAPEILHWW